MKYEVECWMHARYTVTVDADSFEEAKELAELGEGEASTSFDGIDIGDSGIICVIDEDGNEVWDEDVD